uniref:Uncharacterized protein n=1 Tax=Hyaloperonospora arabidopsidis (strain Emoy2) TaxID=559515 RepID=M4B5Z6_HYAAE
MAKPTAYESSRHKIPPAGQQSKSSTHMNFTSFTDQGSRAATHWNLIDGARQYDIVPPVQQRVIPAVKPSLFITNDHESFAIISDEVHEDKLL